MASQETPSNKMESEEPPKTTETAPDVSRESTADEKPKEEEYPKGIKLVIITACLFSSLFLVSLVHSPLRPHSPKSPY